VEGLLDFGRMESNRAEYRFDEVDAGALVRDVASEFTEGAAAERTRVRTTISPALPQIRADREAMSRALWNLLDNAAKYSPAEAPIAVEATSSDGRVVIAVRDHGPGIGLDEQQRIFSKFVRGESAKASGAKGTGLGLAMVTQIMRAHHGEVRVKSRPGDGATFSLVVPAVEKTA